MTAEELALAASVFFSGLAAGFLGGLCTILRPMHRDRRCRRHLQRVEDTHLQDDPCLGPRGDGSGLGGGTAALLHDQLDPIRDHLGGVRPLPSEVFGAAGAAVEVGRSGIALAGSGIGRVEQRQRRRKQCVRNQGEHQGLSTSQPDRQLVRSLENYHQDERSRQEQESDLLWLQLEH